MTRISVVFTVLWMLMLWMQAVTGVPPAPSDAPSPSVSNVGNTFYFDVPGQEPLSCDPTEHTPGFITTLFLRNGPYDFGCLSYLTPGSYFVSVVYSHRNYPNVPLWVPNRNIPVTINAFFQRTVTGDVELRDVGNSIIWNANTSDVVGIHLNDDGNLVFFDKSNAILWQSFDQPLDVLVPQQSLKSGQSLVAGFSSTSLNTGSFRGDMYPGGFVLYEFSSSEPVPYLAIKYPAIVSKVSDIFSDPCNHTILQLNPFNLSQIQEPATNATSCRSLQGSNDTVMGFDSKVAFIRLDTDGNLRGYHADYSPSVGMFDNVTRGLCRLPNVCGPYGICSLQFNCSCPGNKSAHFSVQSTASHFLLTSDTCIPQVPLNCEKSDEQLLLDVPGMDYFANDFLPPTISAVSHDVCKSACAANCSCKAAFYRGQTQDCFLQGQVLSLMQVPHADYVASLKVQLPSSKNVTKKLLTLIVAIGVTAASAFLLFVLGLYTRQCKAKVSFNDELMLLASLPGQPRRFSFKELYKATAGFSQKLGSGGFGSVYRGTLPDGSKIAVKQLENATKTAQGFKEFRAEVVALSNVNHQNLVHLKGFCADGSYRLLVYEYMPNGSLDTWLFAPKTSPYKLDWETRLSIAIHTARGLFFLHEQCRNCIVHLDVKPQNILLDDKFIAKLSDFGLARLINEEQSSVFTKMRGTPGYMAPECLLVTDATEKSDVYSFGMVLLEIVSGRKNVDTSRLILHGDSEGWYFPALAVKKYKEEHLEDLVDKTLCPLTDEKMEEIQRVVKAAFWCIQEEPFSRPTMGNVLLMLQGYTSVPPPPLEFNFGIRFHLSNSTTQTTNADCEVQGQPDDQQTKEKDIHLVMSDLSVK